MPLVHDTALLQFEMPPFVCLRVRGIASQVQPARNGPILAHCGGPLTGRECAQDMSEVSFLDIDGQHEIISHFDLISIDQRGVLSTQDTYERQGKWGVPPPCPFEESGQALKTISRSILRWGRQAQPGLRKASTGAVGDCRGQSIHGRAGANLCPAHLFEQGHSSFRANRGQWILCAMVLSFGATGTQLMLWSPTLQDPGTQRPHVQYIAICWDDWPRLRYWSLADAPFHFFVLHCFLCLPHTHPQSPVIPIPPPQDLLRQAIGAERMSLYGVSYGTSVAGVYATVFPQHTHRVVMDGALHPAPDAAVRGESFAFASQSFWDGIVRDCEALHLVRAQIKGLLSFSKWFHVSLIS